MKHKVGIINLAPTPEGYAHALLAIIDSPNSRSEDIAWAKEQVINAFRVAATFNPEKWGKETRRKSNENVDG